MFKEVDVSDVAVLAEVAGLLRGNLQRVMVGQDEAIEGVLVALLAGGHVLLEGLPGLGKSLLAQTLARSVAVGFRRVQFTPDLLPADVTGGMVFNPAKNAFVLRKGPVFTNFLLADELNRAPAKTQAALLEAMQERQVSIEGRSLVLPRLFMVLATQNPLEMAGTYALPEAQLDRFLLNVVVGFPSLEQEGRLLHRVLAGERPLLGEGAVEAVVDEAALLAAQQGARGVRVDGRVVDYVVALVRASREAVEVIFGAGPRASMALLVCARVLAVLRGRDYVLIEDVQELAPLVLRHRLRLALEAQLDGVQVEAVVARLLADVAVPRR